MRNKTRFRTLPSVEQRSKMKRGDFVNAYQLKFMDNVDTGLFLRQTIPRPLPSLELSLQISKDTWKITQHVRWSGNQDAIWNEHVV